MSDKEVNEKSLFDESFIKSKKSKKEKKSAKEKKSKKNKKDKESKKHKNKKEQKPIIGPQLPQSVSLNQINTYDDDHEDIIGPMLPGCIKTSLEERALEMQIKGFKEDDNKKKEREEWMLELPEVHSERLGFTARSFHKSTGPDFSDRSVWTNGPQSTSKRAKELDEATILKRKLEAEAVEKRNEEQKNLVESYKRKHNIGKSLLEIHMENRKKLKMMKTNEVTERRPFDRNVDLKVTKMDISKKTALMRKAQVLDSEFTSGHVKYL